MTTETPLTEAQERLAHIDPKEPIFILRGQDKLAWHAVKFWADIAEANGVDAEKVAEARQIAQAMRDHTPQKLPD